MDEFGQFLKLVLNARAPAHKAAIWSQLTKLYTSAAERRAVLLEIEPVYADVIVRRWQEATGEAAVLEGDDRIFTDVAAARGIVDHDAIQTARS